MTEVIKLEQASLEHMNKQPEGRRFALFCVEGYRPREVYCISQNSMGHLGDFKFYEGARKVGIDHPHAVIIRFYPNLDHRIAPDDFIADFKNNK